MWNERETLSRRGVDLGGPHRVSESVGTAGDEDGTVRQERRTGKPSALVKLTRGHKLPPGWIEDVGGSTALAADDQHAAVREQGSAVAGASARHAGTRHERLRRRIVDFGGLEDGAAVSAARDQDAPVGQERCRVIDAACEHAARGGGATRCGIEDLGRGERARPVFAADDQDRAVLERGRGVAGARLVEGSAGQDFPRRGASEYREHGRRAQAETTDDKNCRIRRSHSPRSDHLLRTSFKRRAQERAKLPTSCARTVLATLPQEVRQSTTTPHLPLSRGVLTQRRGLAAQSLVQRAHTWRGVLSLVAVTPPSARPPPPWPVVNPRADWQNRTTPGGLGGGHDELERTSGDRRRFAYRGARGPLLSRVPRPGLPRELSTALRRGGATGQGRRWLLALRQPNVDHRADRGGSSAWSPRHVRPDASVQHGRRPPSVSAGTCGRSSADPSGGELGRRQARRGHGPRPGGRQRALSHARLELLRPSRRRLRERALPRVSSL